MSIPITEIEWMIDETKAIQSETKENGVWKICEGIIVTLEQLLTRYESR